MQRKQSWVGELNAQVAAAAATPYALGSHDCLRFSCACIAAMTGEDFWPRFAGYTTKVQAYRTITDIAPTLREAVTAVLGVEPTSKLLAQRGDLMLYRDAGGEHLGICTGMHVAVLGPEGLAHVLVENAGVAVSWRIG